METGATSLTTGAGAGARACVFDAGPAGMACAELFCDVADTSMFPAESEAVQGAVMARRREFATVRACARLALRQLGLPASPIFRDADGAPRWPAGVVGSMTHCPGYRAAVVARAGDLCSVGLDAEPHAALPDDVREFVLRDEERARLSSWMQLRPHLHWDRIVFCAKEAVYKAWFPLTRRWLEFADVSVSLHVNGSFRAQVSAPHPPIAGVDLQSFGGQWRVDRGLIVAATWLRRHRTQQTSTLVAAA